MLFLGYIPEEWKEVRKIFNLKAAKANHITLKDSTPGLLVSPFLLKTLKRRIDINVRSKLVVKNLYRG